MAFGWGRGGQSGDSSRFGKYQIIKLIHDGLKAIVYQARYDQSEALYAVKLYKKSFDDYMRLLRKKYNLWSEGEVGQAMNATPREDRETHPIVRTVDDGHEYGRSSGAYFVVQEFVEGYSLKHLMSAGAAQLSGHRLDIASQVARALDIIHRSGFCHRDFSSDNILLTRAMQVKIIDLGFVAPLGVKFDERIGTPSYMAPEQIRGDLLTEATDIYSFGVILYEMFTGRLPFVTSAPKPGPMQRPSTFTIPPSAQMILSQHLDTQPKPPRTFAPALPEEIEQIILKCMEKDPRKRFGDAQALLRAIKAAAEKHATL
jgi:eukaryotic-like serine/threonine-protein kinase